MTDRELMRQALYALSYIFSEVTDAEDEIIKSTINALSERLKSIEAVEYGEGIAAGVRTMAKESECQHEWVRTGAMPLDEARCLKCGAWRSEEKNND